MTDRLEEPVGLDREPTQEYEIENGKLLIVGKCPVCGERKGLHEDGACNGCLIEINNVKKEG